MTSDPVRPQNLSSFRPTMTGLSRLAVGDLRNFTGLSRLARTSLIITGVMATMGGAGCLVTESPDFTAPPVLPPLLTNLNPSPIKPGIIPRRPGTRYEDATYVQDVTLSFEVISDDFGRPLTAAVLLDFQGFASRETPTSVCRALTIPAGTLKTPPGERRSECKLELSPSTPPGCHSITVVVSHEFIAVTATPLKPGDVDSATWFYQVGVDADNPEPDSKPCKPDPLPRDAGADRIEGGGL